ncbi:alpha/beta fold hydrolase [Streptomyces sp. NPDC056169]|uniref:alpha/beta fold hydrolase n=1 Tax=Streptomyces sp. NPDC056169 TaxID=3345734 RepID=UPI0035DCEDAB
MPGVMADAAGWQPVVDALDVAGPVYVLNRRGRQPSGALGPHYTLRTEIDDLVHVLDAIVAAEGAEQAEEQGVDLFGWSFGGLVALESAAQRLEAVHSLTLYEPVVRPFGHHVLDALRQAAAADDLDRAVEIVNRDVSGFTAEYVARLRQSAAWEVLRPLAAPLAQELTALNEHPTEPDAWGELPMPVTLLLGAENEGVPPYGDVFARIASALPRARVVVMPGQGHLAHVQDPESLARHLQQALGRAGSRACETDTCLS